VTLKDVLQGIPVVAGGGTESIEISGIAYNSKAVKPGFLFAALRGAARNGMDFVTEAVATGAAAVLSAWPKPPAVETAWIQVADAREALALAAANLYGHPSDRMKVVGVTGTKGKTTTSALTAAILAVDASHPVVLGGNIGTPLVERALGLTPAHRVVLELSELQLPALTRGTTIAAYTNVTSDHLDRHGDLAAYRAVKRRLAELVDPEGALVLNLDDPVVATYAGLGTAPVVLYRLDRPLVPLAERGAWFGHR